MKYSRHSKIIELIENDSIETQEDLVQKLQKSGFEVTQSTVSRDIKDLRLIKVTDEKGVNKYVQMNMPEYSLSAKHLIIYREAFISCDYANNLVVLKTLSGMGSAVGESIDSMNIPNIVGTISGDNTVLIVCRYEQAAEQLVNRLINMAKNI
jgi:transcriptional regulator of arginine metabolism